MSKSGKWLVKAKFRLKLIDILKEPIPLVKPLNLALKQYSDDKKRIFNTRGKVFADTINLDIYSIIKVKKLFNFLK